MAMSMSMLSSAAFLMWETLAAGLMWRLASRPNPGIAL